MIHLETIRIRRGMNLREALKAASDMGCAVNGVHGTGEVRITHPMMERKIVCNNRRKDAPRELTTRLAQLYIRLVQDQRKREAQAKIASDLAGVADALVPPEPLPPAPLLDPDPPQPIVPPPDPEPPPVVVDVAPTNGPDPFKLPLIVPLRGQRTQFYNRALARLRIVLAAHPEGISWREAAILAELPKMHAGVQAKITKALAREVALYKKGRPAMLYIAPTLPEGRKSAMERKSPRMVAAPAPTPEPRPLAVDRTYADLLDEADALPDNVRQMPRPATMPLPPPGEGDPPRTLREEIIHAAEAQADALLAASLTWRSLVLRLRK